MPGGSPVLYKHILRKEEVTEPPVPLTGTTQKVLFLSYQLRFGPGVGAGSCCLPSISLLITKKASFLGRTHMPFKWG